MERYGIKDVNIWFDKDLTYELGTYNLWGLFNGWTDSTPNAASSTWVVSQYNKPGVYNIKKVEVTDLTGNTRTYTPTELANLGISTSFTVASSAPDTTPPTLTGLSFPTRIDVSGGDTSVTFAAQASDQGSGIKDVKIWLDKDLTYELGTYNLWGLFNGWTDSTPNAASSTWVVSQYNKPGVYNIKKVEVTDLTGNTHTYTPAELANLGISTSFTVADGAEIFFGTDYADQLTGNAGANTLYGYNGNDTIDGAASNDKMIGGSGNDIYHVRDSGDVVTEAVTEGTDLVCSYLASYTLTANVENGRIMSTGNANLAGNDLKNVIYAGAGNNVINGGAGIDTVSYLYGVAGSTGVTVSLAPTSAQATGGSGTDTLVGIEHLAGSNNADRLLGNARANSLLGHAGDDTLDGGAGKDTMIGGAGNDTYHVRNSGDIVSEAANKGSDLVYSYLASYTLKANVENGRIMSTINANLTGNSLNNVIYAGAGNNVINGGAGSDTLSYEYGANGTTGVNVSLATTTSQSTGGSGTDTISGFENLTGSAKGDNLTGNSVANLICGGNGNDNVIGSGGNDTLYGDAGNDLLCGGAGNDILYGGGGKDLFRFDTALGTSRIPNIDQIMDFSVLDDTIQLENAIFTMFGTSTTGTINAAYFKANTTGGAADNNDYIIYETDTGKIFYDADGNGAGAAVQIALLGANLALTNAGFVLV